jgi:hypothetical protein
MEKKYVVPEGMLRAVDEEFPSVGKASEVERGLLAAIRWLDGELNKITKKRETVGDFMRSPFLADSYQDNGYNLAIRDIRRMFLAPEPEVPEAVKSLLCNEGADAIQTPRDIYNWNIIEAYRRGQFSK